MKLYLYPQKYLIKHGLTAGTIAGASLTSLYSFPQGPVPKLVTKNSQLQTGPATKAASACGAVYVFNHAASSVTIPANWQSKTISYNVYNTAGTLMKQKISNNAGQTETLQVADLPTGIYLVKTEMEMKRQYRNL